VAIGNPVLLETHGASADTVTSDSFTPTANRLIILQATARINAATVPADFTVDNTGGLTLLDEGNNTATNNTSGPSARQAIYSALASASPSAMTVSITSAGSAQVSLVLLEIALGSSSITNVGTGSNNAGDPSATITAPAATSLGLGLAMFCGTTLPSTQPLASSVYTGVAASTIYHDVRYTNGSAPSTAAWVSASNTRSVAHYLEIVEQAAVGGSLLIVRPAIMHILAR
jgi:hypothetical protein